MVHRLQNIAGTPISIVNLPYVLTTLERWISDKSGRFVVCRDVHGVIRARSEEQLRAAHERADLVTPDGMPLVWAAKLLGCPEISRVCGPDLLPATVARGAGLGWKHYFYGSSPETVRMLVQNLRAKFPEMMVVGSYSPPFRTLTAEEDEEACESIRSSGADLVWVGLGSPKQEVWMANNVARCGGAVLLGVGAAFDFQAGSVSRAPDWMRGAGLEWAYRLVREPRRLWRRYLLMTPQFVFYASAEILAAKMAALYSKFGKGNRIDITD